MSSLTAQGVVLRKYFLRETSYILVVFTREFGKIRGVLKGVRDPYPQFAGNFEIFTRCELLFYKKKKTKLDLITGCETLDFFLPIRKDIERVSYANYFIELVDTIAGDYDVNEALYDTLVDALSFLATDASPKRVARIFELKMLDAVGLAPNLDMCTECSKAESVAFYFSAKRGGVLCADCALDSARGMKVSLGTINFMKKIYEIPFAKTAQIKVSKEVGKELETVLKNFIEFHIGREMKSMSFIESIGRKGILAATRE